MAAVVVYEPVPVADFGYGVTYVPDAGEDERAREAMLDCAVSQLRRWGITDVVPQARTGRAVVEIPAAAHRLGAQVVVTGLGAHDLADRALGGETALRLAQVGTTPVLAVPANATAIPSRVAAATDFSPTSLHAAKLAAQWLRSGDELHLLHVTETRNLVPEALAAANASSEEKLLSLSRELDVATGVRIEHAHATGAAARALLVYAKEINADLIALGSHGYGPIKRMLIGSVASKMIRLASVAVLVVPVGAA